MTQNDFVVLCATMTVDPSIALENAAVRSALRTKDTEKIRLALETEF